MSRVGEPCDMGELTLFGLRIDGDVQIGPKRLRGGDDGSDGDDGRDPLPDVDIESPGPSKKVYGVAGLVGLVFLVVLGVVAKRKLGGGDDEDDPDVVTADPFDDEATAER